MQRVGFLLAAAAAALCEGKPPAALLPPWPPTWNMSSSTVFMPCSANGVGPVPFPPSNAARWGIADFDWSNGFSWYAKQTPMNCEETLLAQAEATHALNSSTRVFVYRNAVKALPWFTLVREKLEDKSFWHWFLPLKNCTQYQCGPDATHNLYHDFSQVRSSHARPRSAPPLPRPHRPARPPPLRRLPAATAASASSAANIFSICAFRPYKSGSRASTFSGRRGWAAPPCTVFIST